MDKVLMKGNEAIAEGALMAGCKHFFGYPITPQTEISAYLAKALPKINGTFLQAESEIAAINMVIGASAAGKRAMTSSSSPGIALKSEGLSYLAGCDLPAVLANVQRGGPGLGGIQPSQADYFHATRSAGHGDFKMMVLAPAGVQEMLDFTYEAFDLADQYRMTVMVLADGILGQMMEPVDISPKAPKALPEKTWAATGTGMKRKQNIINSLHLQPEDLEKLNFERHARYKKIEEAEPRHEVYRTDDAEIVIAAYGAAARIARNAVDELRGGGIKAGLIRPVTLWPFPKKAFFELAQKAKAFVAAEMSMGQMIEDVELAIRCSRPVALCSRTGGMVPQPKEIVEKVRETLRQVNGAE
jgi:2-oxoglutarate ferredoxin oxidoreductase subunit alpha